ncbi:MAG: CidA/LrgA family protein [Erysipelothrix sp.]|nr:CidA/LrgA family protein [Erysipelothrix sp.]
MRLLKGISIIFGFTFLGEFLSLNLNLFIPGSIVGLLLLFGALQFKIIKLEAVGDVAMAFQKNMAFLFVPLVVNLTSQSRLLIKYGIQLLLIIVVSTTITYFSVAKVSERLDHE